MVHVMIRKLTLALTLGAALLLGSAQGAVAADLAAPPADTTVTYASGTIANTIMLDTNLTSTQRADITEYDLRVDIMGQPARNLTVKSLPTTLFNVIRGTEVHAYLTVKGNFGTAGPFDGGTYMQGEPATTGSATPSPTRTPVTPAPSPSQTSIPTQSLGATTPAPSTSATPQATSGNGPVDPGRPEPDSLVNIVENHLPAILTIAIITFIAAAITTFVIRRRRDG